ncbi:hypothetical protein NF699_14765 [Sphingomonadaceae bacterium OTU29LAMAA1]|nr:hypothetical protein NF699_14765 [Sphingomonadaceae bacterium OTU29LAMAA1]
MQDNELETPMSRALNVTATETEVKIAAEDNNAPISAIETIFSGGTRVVFMNGADAERMRRIFKDRMVVGAVTRSRWVRNT